MKYEEGMKITVFEKEYDDEDDQEILIEYILIRDESRFLLVNCFTYESSFSFSIEDCNGEKELYEKVNKEVDKYLEKYYTNSHIVDFEDLKA